MIRSRFLYWILFCGVIICLSTLHSGAAEYTVTPSLELRETYDDNVFFEGEDDFEHRISPGLEFHVRKETSELKLTGGLDISKYAEHDELDTVNQTYGASAKAFLNPLLQASFSGAYVADYTFASALEESGVLAERTKRKRGTFGPGVTFLLDPRNSLKFGYTFEETTYRSDRYADYWIQGFDVIWTHALMEKQTRVILETGGYMIDFDRQEEDIRQYVYRALAGIEQPLTETLSITFKAGGNHTKSDFRESDGPSDQEDWGFLLDGSVNWKLERISLSGDISRDVIPSIDQEIITRDRVRSVFTYRLTEKLRGNLIGAYYHSETQGVVEDEKRQTFILRPSLTYRFNDDIELLSGYEHTESENELTNEKSDQNRMFVELSMAWPRHY